MRAKPKLESGVETVRLSTCRGGCGLSLNNPLCVWATRTRGLVSEWCRMLGEGPQVPHLAPPPAAQAPREGGGAGSSTVPRAHLYVADPRPHLYQSSVVLWEQLVCFPGFPRTFLAFARLS